MVYLASNYWNADTYKWERWLAVFWKEKRTLGNIIHIWESGLTILDVDISESIKFSRRIKCFVSLVCEILLLLYACLLLMWFCCVNCLFPATSVWFHFDEQIWILFVSIVSVTCFQKPKSSSICWIWISCLLFDENCLHGFGFRDVFRLGGY